MSNLIGIALPLLGATVNPNTAFFLVDPQLFPQIPSSRPAPHT